MDQRVIQLLIDSFGQILLPGLTMTIPLTVISFSLAMVIAIITALVQFANIRVLEADRPVLYLGRSRHAAAGAAVRGVLRSAGYRHRAGSFPGGDHRFLHQRGRLLR